MNLPNEAIEVIESHPAGVRGLKLMGLQRARACDKSHPAGVRGLKPRPPGPAGVDKLVAPRRGAWIETLLKGGNKHAR